MNERSSPSPLQRGMSPEVARRHITYFSKRFGQAHLYLAYHAAFPLALTPDLLYRLRKNFPCNISHEPLHIPWVAVADLLLSNLCNEVGHELYEMNVAVREALLEDLKNDSNFGDQRIEELANFLMAYMDQHLDRHNPATRHIAQAQRWTALSYINPGKTAHELALTLKSIIGQYDRPEQVRMASLMETFAKPLAEYAPLLSYARGVGYQARGYKEEANAHFRKAAGRRSFLEIEGVRLPIPGRQPEPVPALPGLDEIPVPEPLPESVPELVLKTKLHRGAMDLTSPDKLANQVITILASYIPYFIGDDADLEAIANAEIGEDAYKQDKEIYEAVQKRFQEEDDDDDGAAISVLENFMKFPQTYSDLFRKVLTSLLEVDSDFADELREIIVAPFFIGRNQELRDYLYFLSEASPWLWSFIALEGSGKSELLRQMEKKTPSSITVININFIQERDRYIAAKKTVPLNHSEYLSIFASKLKTRCDPDQYIHFEERIIQIRDYYGKILNDFIDRLNRQEQPKVINTFLQQQARNERMEMTRAFFRLMDSFRPDHLVIHLDSCEWLMEPLNTEARQWFIYDILYELHTSMRQKGKQLHVVMMSNVVVDLPGLNSRDYKQSSLGPLDEKSVIDYLQRIGVDEPALREHFCKLTERHAICVYLLCQLWQEWEKDGKTLPTLKTGEMVSGNARTFLTQFQMEFYERVDREFIEKDIIYKFDRDLKEAIRYGIILRDFDQKKFTEVLSKEVEVFSQLTKRPYIRRRPEFTYEMLELFRVVLGHSILKQSPRQWKKYHKRALDYLLKRDIEPMKIEAYTDKRNHWIDEMDPYAESDQFFQDSIAPSIGQRSPSDLSDWYYHMLAYLLGERSEERALRYWHVNLALLEQQGGVNQTWPLVAAACDTTIMFTQVAFEAQKYRREVLSKG